MLLQTDARRRITLPPSVGIKPGDAVDLELLDDGRIIIIPVSKGVTLNVHHLTMVIWLEIVYCLQIKFRSKWIEKARVTSGTF